MKKEDCEFCYKEMTLVKENTWYCECRGKNVVIV